MSKFHERGKAKAEAKKHDAKKNGPSAPPDSIRLPGGVEVKGYAFRITACDAQGRPSAFEVARGNENSDCVLWASPTFMDVRLPSMLDARWRRRIEESIEGPEVSTPERMQRTYTKERSLGPSVLHVDPNMYDALKQKLLVGDKSGAVTILGRTAAGQVELQINDPTILEELRKGTTPVSIEGKVAEPGSFVTTKSGVIMHKDNQEAALKLAQENGAKGMAMMLEREDYPDPEKNGDDE